MRTTKWNQTEQVKPTDESAADGYAENDTSESGVGTPTALTDVLRDFPPSIHENSDILPLTITTPFSSSSFPIQLILQPTIIHHKPRVKGTKKKLNRPNA